MPKPSAGILLHRPGPEVLLVHPGGPLWAKREEGAWSIPKGEVGAREGPLAAALRELEEELGSKIDLRDLADLGEVRQRGGKVVRAWAARGDYDPSALRSSTFEMEWPPRSGRRVSFPEVDRAAWLGPEQARRLINPAQAELLDRLLALLP
jgi:predicted NUDIX family NTP pyrophosphohydrolase